MEDKKKGKTYEETGINVEELDKEELKAANAAHETGLKWSAELNFRLFKEGLIKAGKNSGPELIDSILALFQDEIP
jgi:hypothetical protein